MRILLLLPLVLVSGCSLFGVRDRAMDYLQAEEQPATRSVDGMTLATSDRYPIPELAVTPARPDSFSVPTPQPLNVAVQEDTVASLSDYRNEALNPRLEKDGAGTLILRLDGGFAAAWAKVTDAVAASSLTLSDLNRSTGTWYLQMEEAVADEDRGWWSRLWGSNKTATRIYLLKMSRARLGVYLSLQTDADTLASEELTAAVLNEIKAQLDK